MPNPVTLLKTAKRAAMTAGSASIRLILPAVCRLCDEPVAEGDDFCLGCSTALTVSEPAMRSVCRRCGVPAPMSFSPADSALPQKSTLPNKSSDGDDIGPQEPTVLPLSEKATSTVATSQNPMQNDPSDDDVGKSCPHCRDLDFAFQQVVAPWSYQGAVCDAIVAAKYVHQSPLGDALGRRLGDRVAARLSDDRPDVVTFVPSHISRQFSRGGNGMEAIAQAVARRLSLFSTPVKCRQLLRTTRRIKKQAWLDDLQRQENVRGAFATRKQHILNGLPSFSKQHILLVDDVLTTGATASEVSRVLCQAGAKRVTLAVLARAIRTN